MFPTAIIYSSHNRCEDLHRNWIVERALKSHDNKTILHLPMSMDARHQQEYGWGTFRWYFDRFKQWGLWAIPFYWDDGLRKEDVDKLFDYLRNYEVVILGGGSSTLGMYRYRQLGERFYGDRDLFARTLRERQRAGKLTVGFSAGADQLCSLLVEATYQHHGMDGLGLVHGVMVTLHHEWGRENLIYEAARRIPSHMVFGLPNDAALAVDQGYLPSGNMWQIIEFIVDKSWDIPEDGWHIKTRQGMNIEHYYKDGRDWKFHGGEKMVRIMAPDLSWQNAWLMMPHGIFDYWSQHPSHFHNIDHILASH